MKTLKTLGGIDTCWDCPFFGYCGGKEEFCSAYSSERMAIEDLEEVARKISKIIATIKCR